MAGSLIFMCVLRCWTLHGAWAKRVFVHSHEHAICASYKNLHENVAFQHFNHRTLYEAGVRAVSKRSSARSWRHKSRAFTNLRRHHKSCIDGASLKKNARSTQHTVLALDHYFTYLVDVTNIRVHHKSRWVQKSSCTSQIFKYVTNLVQFRNIRILHKSRWGGASFEK